MNKHSTGYRFSQEHKTVQSGVGISIRDDSKVLVQISLCYCLSAFLIYLFLFILIFIFLIFFLVLLVIYSYTNNSIQTILYTISISYWLITQHLYFGNQSESIVKIDSLHNHSKNASDWFKN